MTEIKPGERITITAVVESAGHDDQHVIVRIGGRPVQVPVPDARVAAGLTIPFALTPADIGCITEAFEAIAGSATGDLGVYAPVVMARDPKWSAQAMSLLERIDAARPGGDGPDWSTSELRGMIARAAQTPED